MTEEKRSNLPWILAGCGVLLLLSCFLSTAAAGGFLYFKQKQEQEARAQAAQREFVEQERLAQAPQPGGDGPSLPGYVGTPSVSVFATVTSVGGTPLGVRNGTPCIFQVEYPVRSGGSGDRWCHTIARCGGVTLYGGASNGFFPCTFSQSPATVRGTDAETTSGDQDGSFTIDTDARTLHIQDDATGEHGAFTVDAAITRAM